MEYFDIVDENGTPTGQTIERSLAHKTGAAHRTAHVWIFRWKAGKLQVLLQKRCMNKDSFPGCYDISSAGHIPAGSEVVESALRELAEELGVVVTADDLEPCGVRGIKTENIFHEKRFVDNQISWVYILWLDKEASEFKIQEDEIDEVRWFNFREVKELVRNNDIPNCIEIKELELLEENV